MYRWQYIYTYSVLLYIYVYHTPAHTRHPRQHIPQARTPSGEGVCHSARRAISRERGLSRFEGWNVNSLIIKCNTYF